MSASSASTKELPTRSDKCFDAFVNLPWNLVQPLGCAIHVIQLIYLSLPPGSIIDVIASLLPERSFLPLPKIELSLVWKDTVSSFKT